MSKDLDSFKFNTAVRQEEEGDKHWQLLVGLNAESYKHGEENLLLMEAED